MTRSAMILAPVLFLAAVFVLQPFSGTTTSCTADEGLDENRLAAIDELVQDAIRAHQLPGAVVVVGRHDRIYYRKAFGHRALAPAVEPMTLDTIFDLASLTKVVATTTSIMQLVDEGRIGLKNSVADYIPDFARNGKSQITIFHLLTHTSGLKSGLDPAQPWQGYDGAVAAAMDQVPVAPAGERFIYSDINFIVLGEIVRRVGGLRLDQFAARHIFESLGMQDTGFNPPPDLRARIAPTQRCSLKAGPCGGPDRTMLRGIVHDPTARRMGGIAGHAGLFSTADDLATFCRMLLAGGGIGSLQILSPRSVAAMIAPSTAADELSLRGLGWALDFCPGADREGMLPIYPFSHTGFTGTLLWLDPMTGIYVVFLSNRVHPNGLGDVTNLRKQVVSAAYSALAASDSAPSVTCANGVQTESSAQPQAATWTGIDRLQADGFARLRGKRIGLLTNQTGRSRTGARTIDLIRAAPHVKLAAVFSPEHGIHGDVEEFVASSRDTRTGVTIHSLYGTQLRPTPEMLKNIDIVVVDLQDIGTRFYTYATTMGYILEEAARHHISVMVLDRPNPITGEQVEGPIMDPSFSGFTGYFPMPVRHGLSIGELARLFAGENRIRVDLSIVEMKNWRRRCWFDETGLPWVNPSPNIRSLNQALLYPGIGMIEGTNVSVGRGTDTPFEQLGAPWIDGIRLAAELNQRKLAGVRFYPIAFTPEANPYSGQICYGVSILVTDRLAFEPVHTGLEIAAALHRLHPLLYRIDAAGILLGSQGSIDRIRAGEDPALVAKSWSADESQWRRLCKPYLLYPD
jgi:uncharacterized protein YbbC (DUF1343 family)/CubicO group peptidase (beta-lactamase class C family)